MILKRREGPNSRPRNRPRPDRASPAWLRRLAKVGLALSVVLVSVPLFPLQRRAETTHYQVGQVIDEEILAPFSFDILRGEEEIDRDRTDAVRSVAPIFTVDESRADATLRRLTRFALDVRRAANSSQLRKGERAEQIGRLGVPLTADSRRVLADPDTSAVILEEVNRLITQSYKVGIADQSEMASLNDRLKVKLRRGGDETLNPSYQIFDRRRIQEVANERAVQLFPAANDAAVALVEVAGRFAEPNLIYERSETMHLEADARNAVATISGRVESGERIIDSHTKLTPEEFEKLRSLEVATNRLSRQPGTSGWFMPLVGRALLVFMLVAIFAVFLKRHRPRLYDDLTTLTFLTSVSILVLLVAALVIRFAPEASPYLIPVGLASILITLLLDDQLAGAASVAMAILIGIVGGLGLPFVIVSIVGSLAASYAVAGIRHRWEFYRAMIFMSLAYAVTILAVELITSSSPFQVAMKDSLWGVINAVSATTAAIVLLPVFERGFGLCTDITLIELADLNRPIFKRMMLEANGTYHHTMVIGSLSEAAATAVGANPLLARVGAYYHDIGKVPKAEYFGENLKPGMKNPHEKLTPTMSCLILESHVREGQEMAREMKLPKRVADFIPEHQGTTLMSYFYHKALEMDPGVEERDYRYPGPRPQSKETALVMLADSVEATARSLADPSPSRIKAVVKRIIDQRSADGQLDECNLSLQELARARDAFVPVLVGLFHGRIQYQWQKTADGGLPAGGPMGGPGAGAGGRADRDTLEKEAR